VLLVLFTYLWACKVALRMWFTGVDPKKHPRGYLPHWSFLTTLTILLILFPDPLGSHSIADSLLSKEGYISRVLIAATAHEFFEFISKTFLIVQNGARANGNVTSQSLLKPYGTIANIGASILMAVAVWPHFSTFPSIPLCGSVVSVVFSVTMQSPIMVSRFKGFVSWTAYTRAQFLLVASFYLKSHRDSISSAQIQGLKLNMPHWITVELPTVQLICQGVFVVVYLSLLGNFLSICQRYDYHQFITSFEANLTIPLAGRTDAPGCEDADATNVSTARLGNAQKTSSGSPDPPFSKPIYTTAILSFVAAHLLIMIAFAVFFPTDGITRSDYIITSMVVVDPLVIGGVLLKAWTMGQAKELWHFVWDQ